MIVVPNSTSHNCLYFSTDYATADQNSKVSFDNYVLTYLTNIVLSVTVVVNNCIVPNDTYQLYITIDNNGALHSSTLHITPLYTTGQHFTHYTALHNSLHFTTLYILQQFTFYNSLHFTILYILQRDDRLLPGDRLLCCGTCAAHISRCAAVRPTLLE